MLIPHEFIYRGSLQAIGEFHSQFFVDCLSDGDIVAVYFVAQGVTSFTDDWFFGLKVNGADVLTGGDRPQITAGDLSPDTIGLSIPVSFQDRFSPTVDERAAGTINGPITVTIVVDDGVADADVAAQIHAATGKTTPVDADELGIADSAASWVLKKLTWANLKATLKTYFDSLYATPADVAAAVAGLSWKDEVRVATTGNVNLSAPGSSHDGVTLANGERFLAWIQSAPTENGIYIFNGAASPATRSTDADSGAELVSASCYVSEGATHAGKQFVCQTDSPITIGATSISFTVFSTGSSLNFDDIVTSGGEIVISGGNVVYTS